MHQLLVSLLAMVSMALLASCAAPRDSNKLYGRSSLTTATRTIEGKVVSKRVVQVDTSRGIGGSTGGALGAIAGSGLGSSSRENLAGAVIGAVVGASAGAALESSKSTIGAFEYIVKSDVAGLITIIQIDGEFSVGERVYVVLGDKPVLVKGPE